MSSVHRRVASVFALVLCFGGAVGCKKILSLAGQTGAAASAVASAAGEESDPDAEKSEKINAYIECINYAGSSAHRSRQNYLRSIDETKGPDAKTTRGVHVGALQGVADCKKALAKAKSLPPAMADFDGLAETYEKALTELEPLVDQANKYYQNQDFKDDKFAKGISMHAPLVAAYKKFSEASKAFGDKVSAVNDEISTRRLAKLEKDPKERLHYLIEKTLADAKVLVDAADIESLKDLDLAKYNPLLEKYEKSVNDLDAYASAHKDETGKVTMYSRFDSTSKDFLKSTKELMRHKRDNKEFRDSSAPTTIDGHPAQVMDRYNSFIQASNSLSFR